MKKIFSVFAVTLMITLSENSVAQGKNEIAYNKSSNPADMLLSEDENTFETKATHKVAHLKVAQVNIKAVRHFIRSYKKVSDERWFRTADGYVANFLSKGIDTRIVYDDYGRWLFNLLVYSEDKLPFNIRDRVKSQYYDDDIIEVRQYELSDRTVYIITVKNEQSGEKILKVSDDETKDITPQRNHY